MDLDNIIEAYEADIPMGEIVAKNGWEYPPVKAIILSKYSQEHINQRFRRLCALRKHGKLNPMFGKFGPKHHNYVEVQKTYSGYLRTRNIPEWYTGSRADGRVYVHRLKYCEYHGLSELPRYSVVHHRDGNKKNNSNENLELMSIGQHMKHHGLLKAKKKEQRLSRKRVEDSVLEAPDTLLLGDDIV